MKTAYKVNSFFTKIIPYLRFRHSRNLSRTGFTLLELLVVIIILGILAGLAIPVFTNIAEKQKGNACMANMQVIFTAWRIYIIENSPATDTIFGYHTYGWSVGLAFINRMLGIKVHQTNFGLLWGGETPAFELKNVPPDAGTAGYLRLRAQRLTGRYRGYWITCEYYYNGDGPGGVTYAWSGNTSSTSWPWLPEDE